MANQQTAPVEKNDKARPVAFFKEGSVEAAVWKNEGKNGSYHTVSIQRNYLDKYKDQWKNTINFREQDLDKVMKVVEQAHEKIAELQRDQNREADNELSR